MRLSAHAFVNFPNPALVSQREAQPLPRLALLAFCAAYVLPGLFGRHPWKAADITSFGYIVNIAQGKTPWLAPTVGGLAADGALLPYWIGALFVKLTSPWLDPAFAARLPFALLLTAALAFTWYAAYHFARSESAQPLPFAFGGEASSVDYARAIADGALLAFIASLGLLQLGHETTPELVQLVAVAMFVYGFAASRMRPWSGCIAAAAALAALAASGAPTAAMLLASAGSAVAAAARRSDARRLIAAILIGALGAALIAAALGAWRMRLRSYDTSTDLVALARMMLWFAWPTWLLASWTLWQWRRSLLEWHIAAPLACLSSLLAVWLGVGGDDRALMLAIPPMAVMAAFALPTLKRSAAAAIDWFSVFFFTIAAATGWLFYVSMRTGFPAKPGANVAKLSPGYPDAFSATPLAFAVAGTLAWLWLVRWRAGRNRHPLWKSLVLPAGGVGLCWLIAMTLLLPPLDNVRGYRSMIERMAPHVPSGSCVAAPNLSRPQVVALEYQGGYRVDAITPASRTNCPYLMLARGAADPGDAWRYLGNASRNRNDDVIDIYRRRTPFE